MDAYTMIGHGWDVEGTGKRVRVPEGCAYVTIIKSGAASHTYQDFAGKIFNQPDKTTEDGTTYGTILSDPVQYADQLHAITHDVANLPEGLGTYDFTNKEVFVHVHYWEDDSVPDNDNNTYIEAEYAAGMFTYKAGNENALHRSGLYKLGGLNLPDGRNSVLEMKEFYRPCELSKYYKHSLYPTQSEIKKRLKTITNAEGLIKFEDFYQLTGNWVITQSELFQRFPGVYYNAVCRLYVEPKAVPKGLVRQLTKHIPNATVFSVIDKAPGFNVTAVNARANGNVNIKLCNSNSCTKVRASARRKRSGGSRKIKKN